MQFLLFSKQGELRLPFDDDEPVYDRLINFDSDEGSSRSKSPYSGHGKTRFTRVRRAKPTRESVVPFADDLMERQLARGRKAWTPEPMEHTINVYSHDVKMHVTTSTSVPKHKPQTTAPLSRFPGHKRSSSEHKRPPPIDITNCNTTPKAEMSTCMTPGQVHELTKRFSFTPTNVTG